MRGSLLPNPISWYLGVNWASLGCSGVLWWVLGRHWVPCDPFHTLISSLCSFLSLFTSSLRSTTLHLPSPHHHLAITPQRMSTTDASTYITLPAASRTHAVRTATRQRRTQHLHATLHAPPQMSHTLRVTAHTVRKYTTQTHTQ